MKSSFLKYVLLTILFLILLSLAVLFVQPVYFKASNALESFANIVLKTAEDKLGVTISYESLSPSIFSQIEAENIEIKNKNTGDTLISLNKTLIRYDFIKLLQKKENEIIKEIVFEGGKISFSKNEDWVLIENIKNMFSSENNPPENNKKSSFVGDFEFPFDVTIEDILFNYEDENVLVEFFIKKAQFQPEEEETRVTLNSNFMLRPLSQKLIKYIPFENHEISFDLNAQGFIQDGFNNISSQLFVTDFKVGDYSLTKLSFLLSYLDGKLSIRMIQSLLSFSISADWNKISNNFIIRFLADNLDIYELLPFQARSLQLQKLKNTILSGEYLFTYNTKNKMVFYDFNGSFSLPSSFVQEGIETRYSLTGTNKSVKISAFDLKSHYFTGSAKGTCIFENLRIDGSIDAKSVLLPNNERINFVVNAKALEKGSKLIIPKLNLKNQVFENIEIDFIPNGQTFDISMTALDSNHENGKIALDLILDTQKSENENVEISFTLDELYLDSVARTVMFFANEKTKKTLEKTLPTLGCYAISTEFSCLTDLKKFSLHSPLVFVEAKNGKNQSLKFSLSGNESLYSINDLSLSVANQLIEGDIQIDIGTDFSDIIFSTTLRLNDIPYNLAGTYIPGGYISVLGEYDFEAYIDLNGEECVGSFSCNMLPFKLSKMLFSLSAQASYIMIPDTGTWSVSVPHLELQEVSGIIAAKPKFAFSGSANNSGVTLESIMYSDSVSTFSGFGSLSWLYENQILDGMAANIELVNPFSDEQIVLYATGSNPEQIPLYDAQFDKDYYFTLETNISNFSFGHIMPRQNSADTLTAVITGSGTLTDPLVSINVPSLMCSIQGYPFNFVGDLLYADSTLSAKNISLSYRNQRVKNVILEFKPKSFSGYLSADVMCSLFSQSEAAHSFNIPLVVTCSSEDSYEKTKKLLPENFMLTASIAGIRGDLLNVKDTYTYEIKKSNGRIDLNGGIANEISGYYETNGSVFLQLKNPSPFTGIISGAIKPDENNILLSVRNVTCDMSRIKAFLTYPVFRIHNGIVTGNATISGKVTDPEFNGNFEVENLRVDIPKYLTETIEVAKVPIIVEQSTFRVEPIGINVQKGIVLFDAFAYFDRWSFETLSMNVRTLDNTRVGGQFDLNFLNVYGDVGANISIDLTLDDVSLKGSLFLENGSAEIVSFSVNNDKKYPSRMESLIDLTIEVGEKTEVAYPSRKTPILWGQIKPYTKIFVKVDTSRDLFDFKGDFSLRGGEILYVGRNFYLKEGRLVFDANQDNVDPRITFRAEIRERDDNGEFVKIILSAENQLLSQLTPRLSSSPGKSEDELMALLGKALFVDATDSDTPLQELAVGLMDFGAQLGVFRQVERQLRNFLKFDIFSFRTMALQKGMLQAFNLGNNKNAFTVGNLLDDTTVYVGKYFGDAIYADAMLQLVYDETKPNPSLGIFSGLHVQPEIGIEMQSPFATIRWSIAPNVLSFKKNLWVPYNTLTVSWKIQL